MYIVLIHFLYMLPCLFFFFYLSIITFTAISYLRQHLTHPKNNIILPYNELVLSADCLLFPLSLLSLLYQFETKYI